MSNISVAEILKIYGKRIGSKEFVHLVSQKLKITDRHAYNLIKKASRDKSIIKLTLENRMVVYGLPEFGPNGSLPIANIEKGQRSGFFEWLKWKDERKDREHRQREYEIKLCTEKMWLSRQDFSDDEYESKLEKAKTRLQKEHGLI